jgi:hypothetical protein
MNGRMYNIIISMFCIGIIFFIFMTRCKVSKIQLKMKDASLILIFFALLAYINGHEYLFVFILLAFSIIYFTPQHYFDHYLSKFLGKKEKKSHSHVPLQEPPQEPTIETIETDIEIDDNITVDEQDYQDNEPDQEPDQEQTNQK